MRWSSQILLSLSVISSYKEQSLFFSELMFIPTREHVFSVMNHDTRTFSFLFSFLFYFYFSIFRTDLHNQGSHMRGHMTYHIGVT